MWIVSGTEKPLRSAALTVCCTWSWTPYPPPANPGTGWVGSAGVSETTTDWLNAPAGQLTVEIPSTELTEPAADWLVTSSGGGCGGKLRAPDRADDGAVDVVRVDVERHPVPGLVMAAPVLMEPLMVRPEGVRDVRVAEDGRLAVPVGDPDVVGRGGGGREHLEVADRRGGAAVDTGEMTERVELVDPGGDERLHALGAGGVVDRVALHVEVDRASAAEAEHAGVTGRIVGRGGALARGDRR